MNCPKCGSADTYQYSCRHPDRKCNLCRRMWVPEADSMQIEKNQAAIKLLEDSKERPAEDIWEAFERVQKELEPARKEQIQKFKEVKAQCDLARQVFYSIHKEVGELEKERNKAHANLTELAREYDELSFKLLIGEK